MKRYGLFSRYLTIAALLSFPLVAQRGGGGGQGIGRVAGGAVGEVSGRVNGAAGGNLPATQVPKGLGRGPSDANAGAISITENARLSSRVQTLLPGGETVSKAAAGFENQGEFIAAVHAAHNLSIPFDQLKAQMTGSNANSLGKAIQKLRPDLDRNAVKENVKLAEKQTSRDVSQASSNGKPDRVAASIANDSKLSARLTPLLPAGTTLSEAAAGFKNQGQFIAALEVSKNLSIPFADLKDRMTAGESLGAAIHGLKPAMSASEVETTTRTAEEQAKTVQAEVSVSAGAKAEGADGKSTK